jgi:hypothetical protein
MPADLARYPVYMPETLAWKVTQSRVIFSGPSRLAAGTTVSSRSEDPRRDSRRLSDVVGWVVASTDTAAS